MSLDPHRKLRVGDYVCNRGKDDDENRKDAEYILRAQGCHQFRAELHPQGGIIVHGYLTKPIIGDYLWIEE